MLFSILIASYNNGRYFKACFDSIVAQTYQNWEVVIVEDGSTDDSSTVISGLIANDPRFRFVANDRNYGCGFTKRRCVEQASGEVCAFLDPDDTLTPDAVEKMVNAHRRHQDAVLVYSRCMMCDEAMHQHGVYPRSRQVDTTDPSFFNLGYEVLAFVGFKRAAYFKTPGIDPYMQRAVDQDLYLKLAETGRFFFIEDVLYYYRMHNNGISVSNYDRSVFWHWFAIMQAAKRRNINVEEHFLQNYVSKQKYDQLEKTLKGSRVLKITNYLYIIFSRLVKR